MSKEKTDQTPLEKAAADYQAACGKYEKKVRIPTAQMDAAAKKQHLDECTKLLTEKHSLKGRIEALRSNTRESTKS